MSAHIAAPGAATLLAALNALLDSAAHPLANHLWQSTVFAAIAAALALTLQRNQARSRYWIWMAASVKMLLPFALLAGMASHWAKPHAVTPAGSAVYSTVEKFDEPFTYPATPPASGQTQPAQHPQTIARKYCAVALALVWFSGFIVVLALWTMRWRRVARSMRHARPLLQGREIDLLRCVERTAGVRRPIRMLVASTAMEPGVFGVMRPVLAWPAAISERLNDAQLEAVLAHEVCHVHRRDNLTAALHMLVEALFWFHPMVWWIGARLVKERERACDEQVLEVCGRPIDYAESILKVCEYCVQTPLECVSGVTGADLKQRVIEIMSARSALKLTLARKLLVAAVAAGVLAVPFLLGQARAAQRLAAMVMTPPSVPHFLASAAAQASTAYPSPPQQATPIAEDSSAGAPTFVSASVRPSSSVDAGRSSGMQITPAGVLVASASLQGLVWFAYGARVEGGPQWADTDSFDINAKLSEADMSGWDKLSYGEQLERFRPPLQTFLAQKFKLKTHAEMIPTPVYVLTQATGGVKMKEVAAPAAADPKSEGRAQDDPASGSSITPSGFVGHAVKIQEILGRLGYELSAQDKPILDQTGLTGYYDFTLRLIKEDGGPTSEQQMEDQMGLRLESRKLPFKTYLIDSAEKPVPDMPKGAITLGTGPTPAAPAPMPHIHFDVVSFKPCPGDVRGSARVDLPIDSDFVAYHCQPVYRIIYFAFSGPTPFRLSGHPTWVDNDLYEFQAKVAPEDIAAWQSLTIDQKRLAVRDLLADKLNLKIHVDKTPQSAYALTVAKGGAKLAEYKVGEQWKIPDGRILEGRQMVFIGTMGYYQNTSMGTLVAMLSAHLDRPVVDQTGLAGYYDISFPMAKPTGQDAFADLGDGTSIASGLDQLGLKLIPTKTETDGLVVDSIDRPPAN